MYYEYDTELIVLKFGEVRDLGAVKHCIIMMGGANNMFVSKLHECLLVDAMGCVIARADGTAYKNDLPPHVAEFLLPQLTEYLHKGKLT